ncbi:MAG: protease modulator HflC [Fuerstiella sp.]
MNGSHQTKFGIAFAVVFAGMILLFSSMFTINERELGLVLQFGKPVKSIDEPGLYFKIPFVQEVRRVPRTLQFWASSDNDVLVDLPTADGKKIEVTLWAIWKITDPEKFVQVMQTVDRAEGQIRTRVRAGMRDVITKYDLDEVVRSTNRELPTGFGFAGLDGSADAQKKLDETVPLLAGESVGSIQKGRERIMEEVRVVLQRNLTGAAEAESDEFVDRGIELVDAGISNIGYVKSVREKSFAQLNAGMDSIAATYEKEGEEEKQKVVNETKAEVEKIVGQGEEQSKRIRGEVEAEIIKAYADALKETGEFYTFLKTLEVYESAMTSNTQLILTTDSELFRMLKELKPITEKE